MSSETPQEPTDRLQVERTIERRVQQSLTRDAIRDAVLALAEALEPDGQYDPEDDTRPLQAVHQLAQLLEDPPAAEGIAAALRTVWMRWRLGEADT